MIELSREAERQIDALIVHYEIHCRLGAAENLLRALDRARVRIAQAPDSGLLAPRPYPQLKHLGRRWIIEGRYWISYSQTDPPVISGVFHVTANIPQRV